MVDLLGGHLLEAFKSNDFSLERFSELNEFFDANIKYADEMVACSFVSFRDFELWDAWFRIWVVGLFIGTALNASLYLKYVETKDKRVLDNSVKKPHDMLLGGRFPEWQTLLPGARRNGPGPRRPDQSVGGGPGDPGSVQRHQVSAHLLPLA
jgi:FADH2 O2-dependent halogenase